MVITGGVAHFFVGKLRGWVVSLCTDSNMVEPIRRVELVPFVHVRFEQALWVSEVKGWSCMRMMWVAIAPV